MGGGRRNPSAPGSVQRPMQPRELLPGRVPLAVLSLLLLLLTACGQAGGEVTAEPAAPPTTDDDLVLRVDHTGGFSTPAMLASRVPVVSVYADGRVITEGPQIAIFPAPALPNLQVRQIEPEGVETLVDLALEAGVGEDPDLGEPPIADATSTRFTVMTASGTEQLEAYALSEATAPVGPGPDLGLTPEQQAVRAELLDLLDALTNLPQTLGEEAVTAEEPYEPQAVAAIVTPWVDPGMEDIEPAEVAWPGPELPGEPLVPAMDVSCVTATGDEAEAVLDAAADANSATAWTSGDARWSVALRPLLPAESGCEDLIESR